MKTIVAILIAAGLVAFAALAQDPEAGDSAPIDAKGAALGKKVKGDLGERMMDDFFAQGGAYEKIDCSVGVNGIDGLYVTRTADGTVDNVIVAECKTDDAQIGRLDNGNGPYQGYKEYNLRQIDRKIKALESGPQTEETAKQIKTLKQIRRKVEAGDYRSRLFRMEHCEKDGKAIIKMQTFELDFVNGPYEKPIVRESGKVFMLDMTSPDPALKPHQLKMRNRFYKNLTDEIVDQTAKGGYGIRKAFTRKEAEAVVAKIKLGYESGQIRTKNQLIDYIARECRVEKDVAEEIAEELCSDSLKLVRGERMVSGVKKNVKGVRVVKGGAPAKTKTVRGVMFEVEKPGGAKGIAMLLHSSAVRAGAAEGIVAFVLSEGSAVCAYRAGKITAEEFEELTCRNAFSSLAVGGAVGVAVALGASPAGPIVIGIGIGGYWLCDIAFDAMAKSAFTLDDILGYIPEDLLQVRGPFDLEGYESTFDIDGEPGCFDLPGEEGAFDVNGRTSLFDYMER